MDPTLLPARDQADLVASGELSARRLLLACIARYEALNPVINAVVVERIDQALAAADRADAAVSSGASLGPLHGVPMTIKEVLDWVGTPSTWGDPVHRDYLPARNAEVVDRLIAAGAIIWAKTNVPIHLADWQTFNDVYGITSNPWSLDRTPGGSSGGSAASVATGMAGLEVGSDIGGSIRFPAHYCGVFGLKPSFGAVSADGHNFPGQAGEVDIGVVGPLARSATDLGMAIDVLGQLRPIPEPRVRADEFRVGVMLANPLGGEQDDEMTALLQTAIDALVGADMGIGPDPLDALDHVRAQQVYRLLNHAATTLVAGAEQDAGHAARYLAGARDHDAYRGRGGTLSHAEWIRLHNERQELRNRWSEYFYKVDAVLCPVSASPAPLHQPHDGFGNQTITVNGAPVSTLDQWFWAGIASGVYLPAVSAPVGLTAAGLPVGIQIITPWGHDRRAVRLAEIIEHHLGGYRPPPLHPPA